MKIISDSSIMYSIEEGAKHGIEVLPLSVAIDHKTWLEYEDIDASDFLARVRAGAMPKTSCPPPHMILKALDTDDEAVLITLADGLSGSYEVACSLKDQARRPEKVAVLNSKTLCVPHRAIALAAVELAKRCETATEVAKRLAPLIESTHSYLIPSDFDFLRRGGRLTPLAAKLAHMIKAAPVMKQTEDGKRLEKLALARNFKKGIDAVAHDLSEHGVDTGHFIGISHADNEKSAAWALDKLKSLFPGCEFGLFDLGPAFIAQGGPGCVAVQSINLTGFSGIRLA